MPAKVARIQTHLGAVLEELRAADVDGLTAQQRRARTEAVGWLAEYRAAGLFPHNHVRAGERVPVFVDPHGTPCAVGYLMLRSGQDALVEDIVREANLARVPELAGDGRLHAWLDERGLTLAEAARIQPGYDSRPPAQPSLEPPAYAGETVGLTIVTAAAVAYASLTEPDPAGFEWAGWANVGGVVGHVGLLGASVGRSGSLWVVGVNVLGALASTASAAHRFERREDSLARERRVAVLPFVGEHEGRVTLGLTLRH